MLIIYYHKSCTQYVAILIYPFQQCHEIPHCIPCMCELAHLTRKYYPIIRLGNAIIDSGRAKMSMVQ